LSCPENQLVAALLGGLEQAAAFDGGMHLACHLRDAIAMYGMKCTSMVLV
jgi:hypothetical protein